MKSKVVIAEARRAFHHALVSSHVLAFDGQGVPSNSDKGNKPSCEIGRLVAERLGAHQCKKLSAQTVGKEFEKIVCAFLKDTFPRLRHLRPGKWGIEDLGNKSSIKTASFAQYEHLAHLASVIKSDRQLAAMLGNDYVVAPDVVVFRNPCSDAEINASALFVDESVCTKTDIRKMNNELALLHASVSAKWTMRSDRAQNSRTEALGLIRHRKGHLPHIVVVTGEPLPSRLASLALGTGDIDCVYHFALYELLDAVREYGKDGREDIVEQLQSLVDGKRLKDISDLPLDLAC